MSEPMTTSDTLSDRTDAMKSANALTDRTDALSDELRNWPGDGEGLRLRAATALDAAHATIAGLREAAAVPLRDLLTDMGRTADDPMWADHVELPKATLRRWIATVRAALNGVKSP